MRIVQEHAAQAQLPNGPIQLTASPEIEKIRDLRIAEHRRYLGKRWRLSYRRTRRIQPPGEQVVQPRQGKKGSIWSILLPHCAFDAKSTQTAQLQYGLIRKQDTMLNIEDMSR